MKAKTDPIINASAPVAVMPNSEIVLMTKRLAKIVCKAIKQTSAVQLHQSASNALALTIDVCKRKISSLTVFIYSFELFDCFVWQIFLY